MNRYLMFVSAVCLVTSFYGLWRAYEVREQARSLYMGVACQKA